MQAPPVISGSLTLTGSINATGDITASSARFSNIITAQTLVVQTVSSSVTYSSGSNVFGNAASNTQVFTGSVYITGSVGIYQPNPSSSLDVRVLGESPATGKVALIAGTGNGANDVFRWYDGNTQLGVFKNSGNVGIGTVSPAYALDINGVSKSSGSIISSNNSSGTPSTSNTLWMTESTTNTNWQLYIGGSTNSFPGGFSILQSTNARMVIASGSGNVGIGLTSPGSILEVSKDTDGDTPIYFTNGSGGASNTNASITLEFRLRNGSGGSTGGVRLRAGKETDHQGANVNDYFAISTTKSDAMAERMRISAAGYLKLKTVSSVLTTTTHRIDDYQLTQGSTILVCGNANTADTINVISVDNAGFNGAATGVTVGKNSSTSRSINAGGTVNASGADYAEYMTKAITDNIAKGDIVGINSQGLLTNIFNDAISFVVKSTDPSYVGGDVWGSTDIMGIPPGNEATQEQKDTYNAKLETARAKVDRIAFSGQVPCNVTGSNVGDYIIPIQLENGKIGGQAVTNPTFDQFKSAVGKVWKIMNDGRAWIKVIN